MSRLTFHPPSLLFPHGHFETTFPSAPSSSNCPRPEKRGSSALPYERRGVWLPGRFHALRLTCDRCVSSVTAKNTKWATCGVYVYGMDTQRLSFPSTAVAIRKATAQRQSQSVKHVCAAQAQSRDLNYFAVTSTRDVVFTSRSGVHLWRIIKGTPIFGWKHLWIYLSFHCHGLSHHELIHQPFHWDDDKEDGFAFGSSRLRLPSATLRCSRSLTIFMAKCCFTGGVCPPVCLIYNLPKRIFSRNRYGSSFLITVSQRSSSACVCPCCLYVSSLPQRSAQPWWFLVALFGFLDPWFLSPNISAILNSHHRQVRLFRRWPTSISSSGLFDDTKLREILLPQESAVVQSTDRSFLCGWCMPSVTTECARSAVYGCGMVAIRETMTQRHSQNLRNVCADQAQSRNLNFCGLRASAYVWTQKFRNEQRWHVLEETRLQECAGCFHATNTSEASFSLIPQRVQQVCILSSFLPHGP